MRNKIILLMLLSMITAFSYQESYEVLAHFEEIDVIYDVCDSVDYNVETGDIGDGIDERWYSIFSNSTTDHIAYEQGSIPTIRYYVSPSVIDGYSYNQINNATWSTNTTSTQGELIKQSYINSIKKWDNIYYYKTVDSFITKTKLINFVEVNDSSYNLIIFPYYDNRLDEDDKALYSVAGKTYSGTVVDIGNFNGATHKHYSLGRIGVNIYANKDCQSGSSVFERTGAHEFGHVLGLADIDGVENSNSINHHHEELLMGYGNPRQSNITYKDIAGALVSMGFHTASDHKWMYSPTDYGGYKLICSICNGVKYAPSYPDDSVEFECCKNRDTNISDHSLSSGNMMPVASYGNKDYIKCKYCRYVAPFEERVQQEYIYTKKNSTIHTITNDVEGLYYTFEEKHGDYSYSVSNKSGKHLKRCGGCNYIIEEPHAVSLEDYMDGNNTVTCRGCNRTFDKNSGQFVINNINELQRTENGSYILPNGIIILVEEDIQAYLDGTLVFRDGNSEIM